jgi:hypothetical protein
MSARQPGPYDSVARKWLALAERRKASFVLLLETGRWRHYYTSAQLEIETRKADELCAKWASIAGFSLDHAANVADAEAMPAGKLDSAARAEASHLMFLRQSLGLLSA